MFGLGKKKQSTEQIATAYIGDCRGLYDHYAVDAVIENFEHDTGLTLEPGTAVEIIQGYRDVYGWGPIDEWNMPGYVEK